ncbi:MAG TPA: helix-turn-helix transcriptional regulator [Gaiellaceae bacterium]|nr:helix-turn-helix transcriptional regulator [Gaiellaceae bacterium]
MARPDARPPSGALATLAVVLVSHRPFGAALTELVREVEDVYVTARGLKVATFAEVLSGVSPAALRAAVTGERPPSPALIEECARFLRVRPEYFREYRNALRAAA